MSASACSPGSSGCSTQVTASFSLAKRMRWRRRAWRSSSDRSMPSRSAQICASAASWSSTQNSTSSYTKVIVYDKVVRVPYRASRDPDRAARSAQVLRISRSGGLPLRWTAPRPSLSWPRSPKRPQAPPLGHNCDLRQKRRPLPLRPLGAIDTRRGRSIRQTRARVDPVRSQQ